MPAACSFMLGSAEDGLDGQVEILGDPEREMETRVL